jgi:Histidine kinase-, DNA gyrase B-, and HSP90-like ATPase
LLHSLSLCPARIHGVVRSAFPGALADCPVADSLSTRKVTVECYTTKSEGTGLGLSIVRGIIADHEGAALEVKTELGRGTFILTMPIAAQSL